MAAYKRASQQGAQGIRSAALSKLNPIRKAKGKPPLPLKKG